MFFFFVYTVLNNVHYSSTAISASLLQFPPFSPFIYPISSLLNCSAQAQNCFVEQINLKCCLKQLCDIRLPCSELTYFGGHP